MANVGPADYNYDETLSTLRYANRAKNIKNKPKINEDPKDAMLREFQVEIETLKAQLAGVAPRVNSECSAPPASTSRGANGESGLSDEEVVRLKSEAEEQRKYLQGVCMHVCIHTYSMYVCIYI